MSVHTGVYIIGSSQLTKEATSGMDRIILNNINYTKHRSISFKIVAYQWRACHLPGHQTSLS